MLAHRLFPNARYSIWVDSKSQLRRDPLGVLEALLWHSNSVLAISEHGARSSVYDEAKAVVKKNKATPEEVEVQLAQYRQDGLPEDKRFNGKKGRISHFPCQLGMGYWAYHNCYPLHNHHKTVPQFHKRDNPCPPK